MTVIISDRVHSSNAAWPSRPWWMALIGAIGGTIFQFLADIDGTASPGNISLFTATFVAIAVVSFVLTLERRRWLWSLLFAMGWGAVIGLIAVSTHGYNRVHSIFEIPFFSGILAVLIAAPLFQAARDSGIGWRVSRIPPQVAHTHAWTDGVIGAASILFVGIAFALAWLIAGLFDLIGIHLLVSLLQKIWFGFALAGFTAGAAIGILRERDALVATMQRLVMIILSVLAPVLAASLLLFLVSLPITGLAGLWNGFLSAAALMLTAAGGAYLLINAAIGHGDEPQPPHPMVQWSALVLSLVVLPLAALALTAMVLRVDQYGWTPQRIWGVIAASVGLAYGVAGWWAVWRGRLAGFADKIRAMQVPLALGVCVVALILSLPVIDFGAISARDQLARLRSGRVAAAKIDWQAMAFDFGPSGRAALQRIAQTGTAFERAAASRALSAENRHELPTMTAENSDIRPLAQRLRTVPANRPLGADMVALIEHDNLCTSGACVALWIDEDQLAVLRQSGGADAYVDTDFLSRDAKGQWTVGGGSRPTSNTNTGDLATAVVRVGVRQQRSVMVGDHLVRDIDDAPEPPR